MGEQIQKILDQNPSLGWISSFLKDHAAAELYLVGGAVRDLLLKRPTKDFDFVIRGLSKTDLERWFGAHGELDFIGTGFGVYKFVYTSVDKLSPPSPGEGREIDIALPRTEAAMPGSKGGYKEFEVEARMDLPIEMDLSRRDFTVNAMAFEIRSDRLIDPFQGQRDLDSRLLRTVGVAEDRFREDLSRLLRAIRFSCTLSFHIEEATWNALRSLAHRLNELNADDGFVVPRDTIGREFLKSYLTDPACTLIKYQDAGLAPLLFPEVDFGAAMNTVKDASGLTAHLLVALFFSATDPIHARRYLDSYRFNQLPHEGRMHIDPDEVMWLLRSVSVLDVVEDPKAMPGHIFERLFLSERSQNLFDLMSITGKVPQSKLAAVRERTHEIHERCGDEILELLSGDDLIKAGKKPGPEFRELMNKVRDAQLDGRIASKQEALKMIGGNS